MDYRLLAALTALSFGLPAPAEARPSPELWTNYEFRVPLTEKGSFSPDTLRFSNDLRYGRGYPGIGQVLVRVGPIWETLPNLSVATNLTTNVEQKDPGDFLPEIRAELEPSLAWKTGMVAWNSRLRLERRFFPTEARWRVRTRLQAFYQAKGWTWVPFVSQEAFFEDGEYNQNRLHLGVTHRYGPDGRIALAYLLHGRPDTIGWDQTHALTVSFLFSPKTNPLLKGI